MPYYNIQVVLALTVDINFVNLWYFKHSFTFDDYVTIFCRFPSRASQNFCPRWREDTANTTTPTTTTFTLLM